MNLFLLRHAESAANKLGALASGSADRLSDCGVQQAQRLAAVLAGLEIQRILCSPYVRAVDTIVPFAALSHLEVEQHGCLAQGQWVLESNPVIETPEYLELNGCPVEQETKGQFLARVQESIVLIKAQRVNSLLIVSHGHMIRELLNEFIGTQTKVRFPHANAGLSHLVLGDIVVVKFINKQHCTDKTSYSDFG